MITSKIDHSQTNHSRTNGPFHPTQHPAERPKGPDERRRDRRTAVSLNGRFMAEDTNEYACTVVEMSPRDMTVKSQFRPRIGERVMSYIEHFGGLNGQVTRTFDDGFAVDFKISARRRTRIAGLLSWHCSDEPEMEERIHERFEPRIADQKLILPSGHVHPCCVIDVSLSGASIATELRPRIDSHVVLSRHRGRVVRHHEKGFAVEFVDVLDPDSCARTFG